MCEVLNGVQKHLSRLQSPQIPCRQVLLVSFTVLPFSALHISHSDECEIHIRHILAASCTSASVRISAMHQAFTVQTEPPQLLTAATLQGNDFLCAGICFEESPAEALLGKATRSSPSICSKDAATTNVSPPCQVISAKSISFANPAVTHVPKRCHKGEALQPDPNDPSD